MGISEEQLQFIKNEKERCLAWVQHARNQGETDMRQVINWINSDNWPREEEDEDCWD